MGQRTSRTPELTSTRGRHADGERSVVQRAQSGDHRAFGLLHDRYHREVTALVRRETRYAADVADLVQETFTRAWTRLPALRDPDRFRAWLFQIARHTVIDHGRAALRRPFLAGDDDLALDLTAAEQPEPDELVDLVELAEEVQVALDGLARRDAVAITLAAQLGFGPTEIGQALGITANNAKVVLHRARRRLRSAIDQSSTTPRSYAGSTTILSSASRTAAAR